MIVLKNQIKFRHEKPRLLVRLILGFLIAAPAITLFQYHVGLFGYMGFGGLFVNDAVAMHRTINEILCGAEIDSRTIFGVYFIYSPSFYLGPIYNYIINCGMLIAATLVFNQLVNEISPNLSRSRFIFSLFLVFSNLYLLSILLHPNKEIPLILLTNSFVYFAICKRNILSTVVIITLVALFRDAYAIILLIACFFLWPKVILHAFKRNPKLIYILIIILLSLFDLRAIVKLNLLGNYSYILERNINYGDSLDSILGRLPIFLHFPLKLLNNSVSSALRPQFIDLNDRIYVVGIGLWQFGIILSLGISSIVAFYWKNRRPVGSYSKVLLFVVLSLLSVSFGSFTQARYMMPSIYLLTLVVARNFRTDLFIIAVGIIFFLGILLFFLGLGVSVPLGIDSYPS